MQNRRLFVASTLSAGALTLAIPLASCRSKKSVTYPKQVSRSPRRRKLDYPVTVTICDANYFAGGNQWTHTFGYTAESIQPGIGNAKAFRIEGLCQNQFMVFFENHFVQWQDDSLWCQGSGQINNLYHVGRPHGDNNWQDHFDLVAVYYNDLPSSTENCTVLFHGKDQYMVGMGNMKSLSQADGANGMWGNNTYTC